LAGLARPPASLLEQTKSVRIADRYLSVRPRHLSGGLKQRVFAPADLARRDVRAHALRVLHRHRTQSVHGDVVEPVLVSARLQVAHVVTVISSCARSLRSPDRMRVFTVPRGVEVRRAIS